MAAILSGFSPRPYTEDIRAESPALLTNGRLFLHRCNSADTETEVQGCICLSGRYRTFFCSLARLPLSYPAATFFDVNIGDAHMF